MIVNDLCYPKWNSCSWMLMFISSCLCVVTTYRHHKHADTTTPQCDSLISRQCLPDGPLEDSKHPESCEEGHGYPAHPWALRVWKVAPQDLELHWSFEYHWFLLCCTERWLSRLFEDDSTCLWITAAVCSYSRAITSGLSARMKSCHYVECNVFKSETWRTVEISFCCVLTLNQMPKKDRMRNLFCAMICRELKSQNKDVLEPTHSYTFKA